MIGRCAKSSSQLAWATIVAVGGLFWLGPAVANPASGGKRAKSQIRLDYRAVAGCPKASSFSDRVRARLGYDPFLTKQPTGIPTAIVRITPDSKNRKLLTGLLLLKSAAQKQLGTQSVSGRPDECDAIVSSLAAALCIAIDTIEALSKRSPAPSSRPTADNQPRSQHKDRESLLQPTSRPTPSTQPAAPREPSLAGFAAVGFSLGGWRVPGIDIGPKVELGLAWPSFSLALTGHLAFTPAEQTITQPLDPRSGTSSSADVSATVATGGLIGCIRAVRLGSRAKTPWANALAICPTVTLGSFQAKSGVTDQRLRGRFVAYAGLLTSFNLALTNRIHTRVKGEISATLVRTNVLLGSETLWTAPAVNASLGVDVVLWLF
jgi:hypothetical protein